MNFHPEAVRRAIRYGAAFSSSTNLGVNGTETIVAAASNTGGLVVWASSMMTLAAAAHTVAMLAKSSTPTTINDGDPVLQITNPQANVASEVTHLPHPLFFAAGKGLFAISDGIAESGCYRRVLYTLLS